MPDTLQVVSPSTTSDSRRPDSDDRPGGGVAFLLAQLGAHAASAFADRLLPLGLRPLEARGLVERRRDPRDRRNYAISLTDAGRLTMRQISAVAKQHEEALTAALHDEERAQLASLLRRIADEQALTPGVHPGFRRMGQRGHNDAPAASEVADEPRTD
jgi:hypothetical protein